jgi:hypothetical protein
VIRSARVGWERYMVLRGRRKMLRVLSEKRERKGAWKTQEPVRV